VNFLLEMSPILTYKNENEKLAGKLNEKFDLNKKFAFSGRLSMNFNIHKKLKR